MLVGISETYLFDVLESVDYETLKGNAVEHLVIIHLDGVDCVETFDLGEQNERVEVVVRENKLFQLRELSQLV